MNEDTRWASLREAADYIDTSKDTVLRRAIPFVGKVDEIDRHPCPKGKIRYRRLDLGNPRADRRYYVPDLLNWLN